MFKELMSLGSGSSVEFMSMAQTVFGGLMSNRGVRNILSATTRILRAIESFKPQVTYKDVKLQTSTYGRPIPELFGKVRISGNIIWSSPIITTKNMGSGMPILDKATTILGSPSNSVSVRSSFAIALSVGEVDSVDAIYADGQMMNIANTNYTFYNGSEEQEPNSVIQSYIGVENTPAFRGVSYIVFEDFAMEEYNGRLPSFSFDISRHKAIRSLNKIAPEDLITGVTIIPGSGQYVYDTKVQYRYNLGNMLGFGAVHRVSQNEVINQNNNEGKTDFMLSLDHLKRDMPKVKWVSLVVSWFCDSTKLADINIYPACEFITQATEPSAWSVGRITRENARTVTHNDKKNPIYGGTVSDDAVIRGIDELIKRGYKVCFYPMLFVDMLSKPWRGRISGSHTEIKNFFEGKNGYNKFIVHYASLLKGKADAFVIGSEFVQITKIKDPQGQFVGVNYFVKLAAIVKKIMGNNTKITYAADWSEYHHTHGGWFNMDALWSSPNIDMIGIDAYFPLTNSATTVYEVDKIMKGWVSGEGYDFYYEDANKKTNPKPLQPEYAWKNIEHFWSNTHINPDGKQTAWQPKMKKIWFTEYGFPSVDCATNQPNVFFSTDSVESKFPHLSCGRVDFKIQRNAIYATEKQWLNSPMIEQKFVWTWDARPYPFFPAMQNVWADADIWKYGHFLNGKVGYSTLGDVVSYLCQKIGFKPYQINTSSLDMDIGGYMIDDKSHVIKHINLMADIFGFDAYVKDGNIIFQLMRDFSVHTVDVADVITDDKKGTLFTESIITDSNEYPDVIELLFQNIEDEYKVGVVRASNIENKNQNVATYNIGIYTTTENARSIAGDILASKCVRKSQYVFVLSMRYSNIIPSDVVKVIDGQKQYVIRVTSVTIKDSLSILVQGFSDDLDMYELPSFEVVKDKPHLSVGLSSVVPTSCDVIDVYDFDNRNSSLNPFVYCAVYSQYKNWGGATIYKSEDKGETFTEVTFVHKPSVVGLCANTLQTDVNIFVPDVTSEIHLFLYQNNANKIFWIDEESWFNNYNLAMIGAEIVAFQNVEVKDKNYVVLRNFLRGRFGTEKFAKLHTDGEQFTLLRKENLVRVDFEQQSVDAEVIIIARSKGEAIVNSKKITFTLRNYSNIDLHPITVTTEKVTDGIMVKWQSRPRKELSFFDDVDKIDVANYNLIINNEVGEPIRKIFVKKDGQALYSDQMQIEDFGKMISKLDII
ncbi:MAG: glycoside hydrolase TIM-barrel-like domain-containing protein [Alphaproteobacteria bacterium]|nr:glycoside hydrolase TIM-barrel-like domain-containing protein [Rickettsiales bacterium]